MQFLSDFSDIQKGHEIVASELYVSVRISGFDFEHCIISSELQIDPSKIRIKGRSKDENVSMISKENAWILTSPLERDPDKVGIQEHILWLLDKLPQEKISILRSLGRVDVSINCALYYYGGSFPEVYLMSSTIEKMESISANFDFDVYILNNNEMI